MISLRGPRRVDVDTIVISPLTSGGRSRLRERLEQAGFEASSTGGSFSLEGVPYALDVVSRHLPDDDSDDHLVSGRLEVEDLPEVPSQGTDEADRGQEEEEEDEEGDTGGVDAPGTPRVRLVGPEDLLFD